MHSPQGGLLDIVTVESAVKHGRKMRKEDLPNRSCHPSMICHFPSWPTPRLLK